MDPAKDREEKELGFENEEDVLRAVLDPSRKIEFVRVIFPDILGRPMDFSFPSSELENAFRDGKGFDGSSVEGFVRIEESDLTIRPDPATFKVLPWEYGVFALESALHEAIMFGYILTPEKKPYVGDTRYTLKQVLRRAREEYGFDDFKVGPELEFFIFPNNREAMPGLSGRRVMVTRASFRLKATPDTGTISISSSSMVTRVPGSSEKLLRTTRGMP